MITRVGFFSDLAKSVSRAAAEGIGDGLRSSRTASGPPCPECGTLLVPDNPGADPSTERFECLNDHCNAPVWFRIDGGPLMDPSERNAACRAARGGGSECIACQRPLDGEFTPAWSEGNANAYITCRHCRARNDIWDD